MTTDKELMRRAWEFFSHYILVNEMAQERLDAEAETILEALRAALERLNKAAEDNGEEL